MTQPPSPADPLTAASSVRRALLRLSRRLQVERPARTVSLNQMSLMGHLIRRGPMTVGELAALDRAQPQSLTRPLAALEEDELITRGPDPEDGRRVVVRITQEGLRLVAEDMRQRDAWLALAMSRLSETERQVLTLAAGLMDQISQDEESLALHAAHPPAKRRATEGRAS
ncbi:MAG TPA: MarR family transcriptional regulator [Pseudonocardiaceae bacterium]|nr:MarR family transcriptional regulator [Pseudonocardiaceae bacterium]